MEALSVSKNKPQKPSNRKFGLACAGGGIEGAVYEIGALAALQDALDGIDFTRDIDTYVGVSAGAIITSCLANGVSPRDLSRAILSHQADVHPIEPEIFFTPAVSEYLKRTLKVPSLLASAFSDFISKPGDTSMLGAFSGLVNALPVGLFDNGPIADYFEGNFSLPGRTNDFRELGKKLRIVAVELDSGKTVRFGDKGWDHIPISKAIQASSALPAVYVPVNIEGRHFVDGVARRTVHASVALEEGVELLFCLNPIVPLNSLESEHLQKRLKKGLVDLGLPTVLSQTFRTMIYSRMVAGLKGYDRMYPEADIVLFEPREDDDRMFFTNIFSFSSRKETCEHAYQTTMQHLRRHFDLIEEKLERHGVTMRRDVVFDESRSLYEEKTPETHTVGGSLRKALASLEQTLSHIG
jgi:predicted acylesterase/phospholipase RssA